MMHMIIIVRNNLRISWITVIKSMNSKIRSKLKSQLSSIKFWCAMMNTGTAIKIFKIKIITSSQGFWTLSFCLISWKEKFLISILQFRKSKSYNVFTISSKVPILSMILRSNNWFWTLFNKFLANGFCDHSVNESHSWISIVFWWYLSAKIWSIFAIVLKFTVLLLITLKIAVMI